MNNGVLGIIVAMEEEAQPIIDALGLERADKLKEPYYTGELKDMKVILAVTGIGKCNAQNVTWTLLSVGCDRIVNIGTCGDCGNHEPGSIVIPTLIFDGDFDLKAFGNSTKDPVNVNYRYVVAGKGPKVKEELYTYSTFIMDQRVKGAIVDMEAYGIASACTVVGAPFIAIKCISDSADENAKDSFSKNVEEDSFSSVVEKNINQIIDIIGNFDDAYEKIYQLED